MPLSASTVIHFTKEKRCLFGILRDGFRVFYCRESIAFGKKRLNPRVPMVSFCDIPLSEIKIQISKYGSYGIGLTKEWAIRNGLTPILYIESKSRLAQSYLSIFQHAILSNPKYTTDYCDHEKAIIDILRYIKNYEYTLDRKGRRIPNYRFSDEREWRFIPPDEKGRSLILSEEVYSRNPEAENKKLAKLRLGFKPNDIKYIIIRDDSEIEELVDLLRKTMGQNQTLSDIERLTTRILTTQQIKDDI